MSAQRHESNTNEILISAASAIEQMKYEIARELGVTLGLDTSARTCRWRNYKTLSSNDRRTINRTI